MAPINVRVIAVARGGIVLDPRELRLYLEQYPNNLAAVCEMFGQDIVSALEIMLKTYMPNNISVADGVEITEELDEFIWRVFTPIGINIAIEHNAPISSSR